MPRAACIVVLFVCALFAAPASAQLPLPAVPPAPTGATAPPALLGLNSERGRIGLLMYAPPGAQVSFFERVGGALEPVGRVGVDPGPSPLPSAYLPVAGTWRCDRLVREFTAVAIAPDGGRTTADAETRTPDCRDRLEVVVPAKLSKGGLLPVAISDRFHLGGFGVSVCADHPKAARQCKRIALVGDGTTTAHFRTGGDAVWKVRVRHADGVVQRVLTVGKAKRPADAGGLPALLVTGDSLIQGVDAFIADRLQTAFDVTSDTRPGTGLVKQTAVDWPSLAKAQATRLKPAVTVLSLGINDGSAIDGVECCSATWIASYAVRARSLMKTYSRGTRGRVLWLIAPTPRDPRFAEIANAVAAGIRAAAVGQERVRIIDLAALLTPGGKYRDSVRIDGKSVRVRAADGVHLSVAGAKYVAGVVVGALREFGSTG